MAKVFGVSEFQQNALPIFGGPNKPLKGGFETLESGRLPMSSLYPSFSTDQVVKWLWCHVTLL